MVHVAQDTGLRPLSLGKRGTTEQFSTLKRSQNDVVGATVTDERN